jgi:hypothetical protein
VDLAHGFRTFDEAKVIIEAGTLLYDERTPHSRLGYIQPSASLQRQFPKAEVSDSRRVISLGGKTASTNTGQSMGRQL